MYKRILSIGAASLLASVLFSSTVLAEEHTSTALDHTTAAVGSTEAAVVSNHVTEALKHIEPAKSAHKAHPEMLKHVEQAETHLKEALKAANDKNVSAATHHAHEAAIHLEAVGK